MYASTHQAQSVRIARQLASVNFVRELVGGRPTAIDINSLKTGVTSAADHPAPPKATLHHSQQLQQHGFLPSAKVEVDGGTLETSPACPPSPASVPGDYSGGEEEAAEDIDGRFSGGAGGEAGSGTGSSGDCGKRKLSEGGGAQAKRMTRACLARGLSIACCCTSAFMVFLGAGVGQIWRSGKRSKKVVHSFPLCLLQSILAVCKVST